MAARRAFAFTVAVLLSLVASSAYGAQPARTCNPGYVGTLVLTPDANGRSMTLQAPYAFRDRACHLWRVPKGAAVDGASIPRWLWSVVGGPWDGAYRNASVIHDWHCVERTRPWRAVHRVFFDGMIASGVGSKKAKMMYLAVYYGGPRWDALTVRNSRLLSLEMKRVDSDVFKALSAAHFSLANGQLDAAEAGLATAKSEMRTNGDQFAVASLARSIALAKNDQVTATAALDAMILSGVPEEKTLDELRIERAKLALRAGDRVAVAHNARDALAGNTDDEAVQLLAALKRQNSQSSESSDSNFEPTELEFQRLANIVETNDLSTEQIEKLVDEIREPSGE